MDVFRLPPVIEEVLEAAEEICELKVEKEVKEDKEEKEKEEEEREVKEEEEEELRAQMFQLLLELEETREVSQRHEESFMEMQGLLEEERLASAHQAESFTRHIQRLQAQLRSVRRSESCRRRELVLQQEAEEAAAERENDIASLQEELCRLRAELQRLHSNTAQYQQEAATLKAELSMKGAGLNPTSVATATQGDQEFLALIGQRQNLINCNKQLSNKVEQLQQQQDTCDDVYLAVRAEGSTEPELRYITLSHSGPGHLDQSGPGHPDPDTSSPGEDVSVLKVQLRQAEDAAQKVQRECDVLKDELDELQQLYEDSQRQRTELVQELQRCKDELDRLGDGLGDGRSQTDAEGWNLMVAAVAVAAVLILVVPSLSRA
ncbi:coiled-coil domain-containing protein 136-like [Mugil cephalus]|uniref:coiled-coil domain-containing protein 136-like n=1 Tax=Mugil cephalus TaxID=48193 RepID=UPI001FB80E22|nr:coiled-coil domain-containing protein 136-like [Mugil cephalus]